MFRYIPPAALASLTLHFFVATSYSLMATDSSCSSSSGTGCSCKDYGGCEPEGLVPSGWVDLIPCEEGEHVCIEPGELTTAEVSTVLADGYERRVGGEAKFCSGDGPLEGSGCNDGTETSCKEKIFVSCSRVDFTCEAEFEEVGFFVPCQKIE